MNQDRLRSQHVPGRAPQGLLAKALTLALSTTLLIAGFMFSLILLAIVATVLLLLGGWLWWKTRARRRTMRDGPHRQKRAACIVLGLQHGHRWGICSGTGIAERAKGGTALLMAQKNR